MRRRIVVAGGGTAGHIVAALDFLSAYRQEFGAEGCYIGSGEELAVRLTRSRGERIETVPGRPFARQGLGGKAAAIACIPGGVTAARRVLRREGAELVIGAGGYASFHVCLAARSLGLPLVIHEANVQPGIANRTLSHCAGRICLGFEETSVILGSWKTVVTGIPTRLVRGEARVPKPPFHFVVTGGSQGSAWLNREAPVLFAALQRRGTPFSVHHLAGLGNSGAVAQAYAAVGIQARVEEFSGELGSVYTTADFAISAAGALTLADLAAAGLPALLVPDAAAAHGHQIANARAFAARTGAPWVTELEWNAEQQADTIARLLGAPQQLESVRLAALAWSRPHAARDLVRVCEELLTRAHSVPIVTDEEAKLR